MLKVNPSYSSDDEYYMSRSHEQTQSAMDQQEIIFREVMTAKKANKPATLGIKVKTKKNSARVLSSLYEKVSHLD